jgi:hypothetical protein
MKLYKIILNQTLRVQSKRVTETGTDRVIRI